jgi:hypothetical protein
MNEEPQPVPTDNNLCGKVAAVWTCPETVLDDIQRVMELSGYTQALPAGGILNHQVYRMAQVALGNNVA